MSFQSINRKSVLLLPWILGGALGGLLGETAQGQGLLFSVDYHGPTISMPDSAFGSPITEGDILGALPALGPLPTPSIIYAGGVGPTPLNLGLAFYPAAIGHPPGVMGFVEVDAFSLGVDPEFSSDFNLSPGSVVFSVDEFAASTPSNPLIPSVFTESPVGDGGADLYTNLVPIPLPNPVPPPFSAPHMAIIDGDGLPSGSGFRYPGLGLIEPNAPAGAPPDFGDNLDALELNSTDFSALFFSLDSLFVDPHPLMGGLINSGSAFAHGFAGSDVLITTPAAGFPVIFASGIALGLAGQGDDDPDLNDIDALVVRDNGNLIYDPPQFPDHWFGGAADMLFFSVRRGSAVIGRPDSLRGIPIEEGDILMPPVSPLFGGLSPNPGIYVLAESLGLATVRSGSASPLAPAFGFADDLDALDLRLPAPVLLAAEFCHCPAPAPCGNPDPLAGCANSTGLGAHLQTSGSSSTILDDLVLTTTQLPTNVFGIYFMGPAQVSLPLGDGLRCVGAGGTGLFRYAPANSGAAGTLTLGPGIAALSLIRFGVAGAISAPQIWNFQCWYRNPGGPCGSGFNVSNGAVVQFVP